MLFRSLEDGRAYTKYDGGPTLAEGLETVLVAEAALASARGGATVAVEVAI